MTSNQSRSAQSEMTMTGHCPVWMYLMSSIVQILGPNSFTREVTMILAHWRLQSAPSIVIRNRTRKLWWAMSMKNLFTNKGWFYTYIHVTVSLTSRNISSQKVWDFACVMEYSLKRNFSHLGFFTIRHIAMKNKLQIYLSLYIVSCLCFSWYRGVFTVMLWSLLFMTSFWLRNVSFVCSSWMMMLRF